MIFLGVDGGGTKTEAVLCDENGNIMAKGVGGPSNLAEIDRETVLESLEKSLEPLEIQLKDEVVAVLGMPSVGEIRGIESEYSEMFESLTGLKPHLVVNDVVIGWAAGTLGEDGIHVIAGTGSIAYGRYRDREARSGGWGSLIGDEGSAYQIGVETLRAVSMEIDGRIEGSFLRDFIFEKLSFRDHYDFVRWVYRENPTDRRRKIASVAVLTHEAAKLGDTIAKKILERAGEELSRLVVNISEKLGFSDPLITYSGGVLENNEIVRRMFEDGVRKLGRVKMRKTSISPVIGAVILGMKSLGVNIPWEVNV